MHGLKCYKSRRLVILKPISYKEVLPLE